MEIIKKDNNNVGNEVPKFLETPEYMIINTQLYDKTTMMPVKFRFTSFQELGLYDIWYSVFKRTIRTNSNHTSRYFEQSVKCNHYTMIEDNYYLNRFVLITGRNTTGASLLYVEQYYDEDSDQICYKLIYNGQLSGYSASCSGSFHSGDFEVIYQDKDYFLVKDNYPQGYDFSGWRDWYGNYCALYKINKVDGSTVTYHSGASRMSDYSYNYYFLEHHGTYDYVYIQYSTDHYVIRCANGTKEVTTIYNNPEPNSVVISGNPVQIGDYHYYLVDGYNRLGIYRYQLCRIRVVSSEIVTHEYIDIDGCEEMDIDTTTVVKNLTNVNHVLTHELLSIVTKDNKKYIIVAARSPANGTWYRTQHKLAVIRIDEDDTLGTTAKVTQVVPFNVLEQDSLKGVLSYYEEPGKADILITLHYNYVMFWKFDYNKERYIRTYSINGLFYVLGIDELGRVYVQDNNSGITVIDKMDTVIYEVYFIEKSVDINTKQVVLCYYTKNCLYEYTSERVLINLYNGLTFSDGTTEKAFTSSVNGPTEVIVNTNTKQTVKAMATIRSASNII